jgi:DNA-binding MarR family transcriptional regulator
MAKSSADVLPIEIVRHVATTCLCLHTQRAARTLARLFDTALRPHDLTNQQFSLLMALNRPASTTIGGLATFLAMDRTSLTAALKPLERRALVQVSAAKGDRRQKLVAITPDGVRLVRRALPIWREVHAQLDAGLGEGGPDALRAHLGVISTVGRSPAKG